VLAEGHFVVAHLQGIDFNGILTSTDFSFNLPFDVEFAKIMLRTTSHLLGGDACGLFAFTELTEISVLLDPKALSTRWRDAADLQSYLVGQAVSKMSLQLEEEALFSCKLYSFSSSDLVIAFFLWRRQEAAMAALDRYCRYVLAKDDASPESVDHILDGLGPRDKEEILRQNEIEYSDLPAWQRQGAVVHLMDGTNRIIVDAHLPSESDYRTYLQRYLD
jgi:tRNA(His) 5'-end guanylyltransferase